MGILILFVMAVGAGTIVYFVWKFVAGIFKAAAIERDKPGVTVRAMSFAENPDTGSQLSMDGKIRFTGGGVWFMGTKL